MNQIAQGRRIVMKSEARCLGLRSTLVGFVFSKGALTVQRPFRSKAKPDEAEFA